MSVAGSVRAVTTLRLTEMKQRGEKIAMLTSYDYSTAKIVDAAGIDVTRMGDLQVRISDRYEIRLGDRTQLAYKISRMKNVIDYMQSYAGGVVDLTDPDNILYQPS